MQSGALCGRGSRCLRLRAQLVLDDARVEEGDEGVPHLHKGEEGGRMMGGGAGKGGGGGARLM